MYFINFMGIHFLNHRQLNRIICFILILGMSFLSVGCSQEKDETSREDGQADMSKLDETAVDPGYISSDNSIEPISRYYGSIDVESEENSLILYDIKVFEDNVNKMEFSFYEYSGTEQPIQKLTYTMDSFHADTVVQGMQVADVNNDGSNDMIMDLGIVGHNHGYMCLVYDSALNRFVEVEGYDELFCPDYLPSQQLVLSGTWPGEPVGLQKYRVDGSCLTLVAKLTWTSTEHPSYTEEMLVDGVWTTINKDVTIDVIDLDKWGKDIGMWQ